MAERVTRKKQFNKYGLRREMTSLVLNAGCVTNYDFSLMEDATVTKNYLNVYKRRMVQEGFLKEIKFKADGKVYRICRLANYGRDRDELLKDFGEEIIKYYDSQKEAVQNNIKESSDPYRLLRAARKSYTTLMMSKAYIKTYADDFNKSGILEGSEKIGPNESCFLYTDEVKRSLKNILASRSIGLLLNPDETFLVYTQANARLQIDDQELRMRGVVYDVDTNLREVPIASKEYNAIIISEPRAVVNMFKGPREVKSKRMISVPESTFDKLYFVPTGLEGTHTLSQMTSKNWERNLKKKYLSDYDGPKRTWLTHHATLGDDTYIYLFCISDLNGLHKFLTQSKDYLDELKFEILCYDYQLELLKEIVDERISLKVVKR